MWISRVEVSLPEPGRYPDRLLGFAAIVLDGGSISLRVEAIQIVRLPTGRVSLSWPSVRAWGPAPEGKPTFMDDQRQPFWHRDVVHPRDRRTRALLDAVVLDAYCECVELGLREHAVDRVRRAKATA